MASASSRLAPLLARQELATPERMDQLFVVIGRKAWIGLLAMTVLLGTALAWACLARIPETVQGAGILVGPRGVRLLQAPQESLVVKVLVRPGQQIAKGEVLADVNLPHVQGQLEQTRIRLVELLQDDVRQQQLEKLRAEQEQTLRLGQAKVLDQTIREAETLLSRLEEQAGRVMRLQHEQTANSRPQVLALRESLTEKVTSSRKLVEQRLLPAERLLDLEARLLESSLSLANLDMRLAENDLKAVEYAQVNAQQRARIADLRIARLQLDTRATQVQQEIAQARATRLVLRQEQEDRRARFERTLKEFGVLRSPQAGRLTELLLHPGQVLQAGARIGTLELEGAAPPLFGFQQVPDNFSLTHLAYFPVSSGKRIRPGLTVRVTPTTVQRERFGSMVGTVRGVSSFPITHEAAATMLGNSELAAGLLPAGGVIEVEVELEPAATPSGYRWTSAGPPQPVTAGTTTLTRVIVEERAPITYLFPVLRTFW